MSALGLTGVPEGTQKQRFHWMDIARGCAIVLIITVHSGSILKRVGMVMPEWSVFVMDLFAPVRMPLLMFLSGMLLPGSLAKGTTQYVAGKLRKIGWPLVVWTLILAATVGTPYAISDAYFWLGISHLWFLLFLLVSYAVALLTRKLPFWLIAGSAYVLAVAAESGTKYSERLFLLMCIFFLGAWAASKKQLWLKWMDSPWALISLPAAAAIMIGSATVGPFHYQPKLIGAFLIGSCGVMVAIRYLEKRLPLASLRFIGENSIVFYLSHFPIIFGVETAMRAMGATSSEVYMLVAIAVSLAAGVILTHLSKTFGIFRALFEAPRLRSKQVVPNASVNESSQS